MYNLTFNYDSGESNNYVCVIYEKEKKYETGYGDLVNLKDSENKIVVQSSKGDTPYYLRLYFQKQDAQILYSKLINAELHLGTKTINGPLEMYGKYEKKGKAFTVDAGTFSIYWENAVDYGEQPQLLTGTWTLRRK